MHDLTKDDLEVFRGLGIASVVDLRSVSEVERTGRGLLADEPLHFVNSPVLSSYQTDESRANIDEGYMTRRYLEYLEVGAPAFVRVIDEMTHADSYPLVFNCFLGKDRTGVVAALVLSCVGVRRSSVVEDYALTAPRVALLVEKLLRRPPPARRGGTRQPFAARRSRGDDVQLPPRSRRTLRWTDRLG